MTLTETTDYIHSLYRKGAAPGLARTAQLLGFLGNPQEQLKFVHVAGTNGKGSTAAMTASILTQAGYRTGLFTSPYLYRFHERIQIDGRQIADDDLIAVVESAKTFVPQMFEVPTEFEFVTAIAMEYFRHKACDIVVLEVGMGGKVDPTNIIGIPEVAVITNIGLDHTEFLGNTLEAIAENKAGIIKEGGTAVTYRGTPGVEAVFEGVCARKNAVLKKADFDSLKLRHHDLTGQVFDCGRRKGLELPLLGTHQLYNASVVLSTVDALTEKGWHISEENIREGIRQVTWPGRFDILCKEPLFIIDGGHNPQCIDALVKNIESYLAGKKLVVLTGVLQDKDYTQMYRPVLPLADSFVCITPPNPRKMEGAVLAAHLTQMGARAIAVDPIPDAVAKAIELAGKDGVVLSFGSLYTIGDVRDGLYTVLGK